MSVWSRVRPGFGRRLVGWSGRSRVGLAAVLVPALVVSLLLEVPAQAQPAPGPQRLRAQTERLDKVGGEVGGKGWKTSPVKSAALPAPVWPKPGKARVDLTSSSSATAAAAAAPGSGRGVRAGGLPVWVQQAPGKTSNSGKAVDRLDSVDVEVLDRAKAPAGWRDGVLVSLTPATSSVAGAVEVSVDYSDFRYAAGGDWASRLRLWQMPACALSSPGESGCQPRTLATTNDVKAGVASTVVDVTNGGTVVAPTVARLAPDRPCLRRAG